MEPLDPKDMFLAFDPEKSGTKPDKTGLLGVQANKNPSRETPDFSEHPQKKGAGSCFPAPGFLASEVRPASPGFPVSSRLPFAETCFFRDFLLWVPKWTSMTTWSLPKDPLNKNGSMTQKWVMTQPFLVRVLRETPGSGDMLPFFSRGLKRKSQGF